ncbi:MAG: YlbF family regulator [Candidatus Carbobacillus altaicus]|uniref:ComK regulator n=1 Tax=Candidatus Carbonibacillus altaicus TaxID=2163959 RepID=A0A2R6Y253_9BACL|nr:YlbF family regulator [Candidatus Carbobacillus altaicus]PTQ56769.1 MAG: ComK regulator [Candidatus Carbobacillus altaicus]
MDYVVLTEHLDAVIQDIVESELAENYRQAVALVKRDPEAQRLMRLFVEKKERFEEARRFGSYHPDFSTLRREVYTLKAELESLPSMRLFRQAEQALQQLLDEIGGTLAGAISPSIVVTQGDPFYTDEKSGASCGTGCATCHV